MLYLWPESGKERRSHQENAHDANDAPLNLTADSKHRAWGKAVVVPHLCSFPPFFPVLPLYSLPSLVLAQCSDKHKNRLKGLSRHSMLGVPSLQILTPHSTEHGSHPNALQTKGRETWREVGAHKWNCSVHSLGFLRRTFHHPAQCGRQREHSDSLGEVWRHSYQCWDAHYLNIDSLNCVLCWVA